MAEAPQNTPEHPPAMPENRQPDYAKFGIISGFVLVIIPFVLQSNGVEVNWWLSGIIYLIGTALGGWSLYRHFVPHWKQYQRGPLMSVWLVIAGLISVYGSHKQYVKEHQESKPVRPPTIHDLFVNDFHYLAASGQSEIGIEENGRAVSLSKVEYKVWYDVDSKSKFVSVFIPSSSNTFEVLCALPELYKSILNAQIWTVVLPDATQDNGESIKVVAGKDGAVARITVKRAGDYSSINPGDLVFTGRIFAYSDDDLSLAQLGILDDLYRSNSLSPQFRGTDYATTKWFQMRMKAK